MALQREHTPGRRREPPALAVPLWPRVTYLSALLAAMLGLAGLIATLRTPAPPDANSGAGEAKVRYAPGPPLADRLVIVFAPQFDEPGLAEFRTALGPVTGPQTATVSFTIEQPDYTSFPEATVLLLAGSTPGLPDVPASATQEPPDTIVRSALDAGRGALLFGPPEWRALFVPTSAARGGTPTRPTATLAEAGAALRARGAGLVAVYLRDVTARDLRPDAGGELRAEVAAFGAALDERDAILVVGAGGLTRPLHATLGGPGVRPGPVRPVALNAVAPTCSVILGTPYPAETRGRVAWFLLDADDRRKAVATTALARQRAGLADRVRPPGVAAPPPLRAAVDRLPAVEGALRDGQFAFGYQLASSSVDEADRALAAPPAAPLPPAPRVAWWLVGAGLGAALLAIVLAVAARAGGALGAAGLGAAVALLCWFILAGALRRAIWPSLPVVSGVLLPPALLGGALAARLARPRGGLAGALLVLLAGLPLAACAYRYGIPWRLRPEETAPLLRWRSALLAPALLALIGAVWGLAPALFRRRTGSEASRVDHPTAPVPVGVAPNEGVREGVRDDVQG